MMMGPHARPPGAHINPNFIHPDYRPRLVRFVAVFDLGCINFGEFVFRMNHLGRASVALGLGMLLADIQLVFQTLFLCTRRHGNNPYGGGTSCTCAVCIHM